MSKAKHFFSWEWISTATKSIFKLASYIIELPMVAAGIYIMIDAGIWANDTTHTGNPTDGMFAFAMSVLLASPEILAPGAFFRAETMITQGKHRVAGVTRWLAGSMLFLAALTFSSIMIFHFSEQILSGIMFFRVIASLGYSIITRIDMERHEAQQPVQVPTMSVEVLIQQALTQHTQDYKQMIADLSQRLETANNLARIEQQRLQTTIQEVKQTQQTLQIAPPALSEEQLVSSVVGRLQTVFVEQQAASTNTSGQKREQSTNTLSEPRKRLTNTGEMEAIRRAKKIDPDEVDAVVHPLLDKDSTLTHRKIAVLPGVPYTETVVYASVKRWREQHPIERDTNTDDASDVS